MGTYSSATRSLRNGSLTIKDGSGTPKTVTDPCMDGDLTWTIANNNTVDYCRGVATGWRKGNKEPCKISFTLKMASLLGKTANSADPYTAYEILTNQGSAFTSTVAGAGGVYALDLVFTLASPDSANDYDETVTFTDMVIDSCVQAEGDPNTIKVDGRMLEEKPTVARA